MIFFPGQGTATTFDQLQVMVGFIRTIGHIQQLLWTSFKSKTSMP